jgi:hypothetical protein
MKDKKVNILQSAIYDEDIRVSRQMRKNLYDTYIEFMNNKKGINGGKKSNIDLDLLTFELKQVELYGKQMMMELHFGNLAIKALNSKNKILIEEDKKEEEE